MPSLLPGLEYDIFISYRHKDNKYDGWVSEFVANLRKELEATFKQDVSIYFDENPHDGLRETHDVDRSLASKLNCIIFIPIISQTYCDPESFAWQHEFLEFIRLSSGDHIGKQVRLSNGNVASRILPIKIHDLDKADKDLLERELKGVLRSIDFIFKSPGVNRPLSFREEHSQDNLNKTYYRDQINKVANAIKEIISSLLDHDQTDKTQIQVPPKEKSNISLSRFAPLVAIGGLLLVVLLIFITKNRGHEAAQVSAMKSIAIIPFKNLSVEKENQYFTDGVVESITDHLSRISELHVISRMSVEQYRDTKKSSPVIADELKVSNVLDGSVQKVGDKVRVSVRLIDARGDKTLWAKEYDRQLADIFAIQSEIAQEIAAALKANLTSEIRKNIDNAPTNNLEAYDLYLKGLKEMSSYFNEFSRKRVDDAMEYFRQAIGLDPNFSLAYTGLGNCYRLQTHFSANPSPSFYVESKRCLMKAIEIDPSNGWAYSELGIIQHGGWDKEGAERSFAKALELMPNHDAVRTDAFWFYSIITQNCAAAETLHNRIKKVDPTWPDLLTQQLLLAFCTGHASQIPDTIRTQIHKDGLRDWLIINSFLLQKKYDRAIQLTNYWMDKSGEKTVFLPTYAVGKALAGQKQEAINTLNQLEDMAKYRHIHSTSFAMIYQALGDEKKSFEYLEKALEERDGELHSVVYTAPFYEIRKDPKFISIIERSWRLGSQQHSR